MSAGGRVVRTRLRGRMIGLVALAHDIEYRLSPLEDRRPDCLLHDLFRLSAPSAKVATQSSSGNRRPNGRRTERRRVIRGSGYWFRF